ncbi:MAG: sigma-70 family RNA polymerase sigma factor [Lewinella sp.]|nr:sigma-70 family RNA polymerase sigma factor [Lewinella sp.]
MNTSEFVCDFNKFSHYLKAFALKLTKDIHLAEDLYQDTALRAFRHRDKYTAKTNMKAWLSTIMKNTFINEFRKRKRWEKVMVNTSEDHMLESESKCTWNAGEEQVRGEVLEQEIEKLEDPLRIPFLLMIKGYKYEEIAHVMDLPLGTIKSRIFMARRRLKDKLRVLYGHQLLEEMAA